MAFKSVEIFFFLREFLLYKRVLHTSTMKYFLQALQKLEQKKNITAENAMIFSKYYNYFLLFSKGYFYVLPWLRLF